MNNLQFIIKDNSCYAMHVAVELCEQGDFDSANEAFKWLMQERDDSELGNGTCEDISNDPTVFECSKCGVSLAYDEISYNHDWDDPATVRFCLNCGKRVSE